MTTLKRTQTPRLLWLIRGIAALLLAVVSRLPRVRVPLAGVAAALARLGEERVPLAEPKRR